MQKPADIWMPALIAGAIFGFLSGVPVVGILNCACCSLVMGAGVLAAFLVARASDQPLTYGRAALAGLISGVIAAPVESITSFLFTVVLMGRSPSQQMEEMFDRASQYVGNAQEAMRILNSIPMAVLMMVSTVILILLFAPFGALGGVIGCALFGRRATRPPAQPVTTSEGGAPGSGPMIPS